MEYDYKYWGYWPSEKEFFIKLGKHEVIMDKLPKEYYAKYGNCYVIAEIEGLRLIGEKQEVENLETKINELGASV